MKVSRKTIVIAILILLLGLWHTVRMMSVKYWMEDYLKKEYGKEFVVNRVGYIPSYYGDGLKIKGIARPKDDPSLKFDIIRDASGGVFGEYPMYGESYIRDLWEKQKREELKIFLRNDIVWASVRATYKKEELYGKTVDINTAEEKFKDRIRSYIYYGLAVDYNDYIKYYNTHKIYQKEKMSKEYAEYLYNIIKKIKNDNYKQINLVITYFNKKYQEEVRKDPEKFLKGEISESQLKKGIVLCQFQINDINHVDELEDIEKNMDTDNWYQYISNN